MPSPPPSPYPSTRSEAVQDLIHGVMVPDPFRWLEDGKSAEVKSWMQAEDALTRAELGKLPERDAIAARLKELFYIDTLSAPRRRGGRFFYSRRHADKEKAIVYWKEGRDGQEKVLFDPNTWSTDGSSSLGSWAVTWDGKTVAYAVRVNNSDEATLHVMDVATGKISDVDVIEGAKYAQPSWTPKGDGFYYTWLPMDPTISVADRPGYAEVRFHALGTDPKKDRIIHERTQDPTSFIGAELSRDGRFLLFVRQHGWTSTELSFRDLHKATPKTGPIAFAPLTPKTPAHYEAMAHAGAIYVMSDEGAPKSRMFRVDPAHAERAKWKEIVAERPDATLTGFTIVGGRLALNYLKNATSLLELRELDGKFVREVELGGLGSVAGPIGNPEDDDAYFGFDSFTTPPEVRELSIKSGQTKLYSRVSVPVDPSPYMAEQVFYPSKDGTQVSMFIIRRKDLPKDGSARAMLYGYGGFQINQTPSFVSSMYPWLERGGIYVITNLRGGSEYGEEWHKAGMLLKKQNVFDDFIGAAEYLVRERYTRSERLVIAGGSNGGLLVGAAMVQRPELFAGVLCGVPLLDMVRYHLFGSGKTWISEYGSADDAEQFKVLMGYSPYHHVKPNTKYPALLLLSADSDDRVDPLHARKFAAVMQQSSTGGPVLLRIEKNSGHGGADMVKAAVELNADRYAFALHVTAPQSH
jgi:prolyl oligopeptidase